MVNDLRPALRYSFSAPLAKDPPKDGNNGTTVTPDGSTEGEGSDEQNETIVVHVSYTWKAYNWSLCSAVCDNGEETREVKCVSESNETVGDELCDTAKKPANSQTCFVESCANYQWVTSTWSEVCFSIRN